MSLKIPDNLIHAAFFFVDIVGLSNPSMSTNTQTTKIKTLNNSIKECKTFKKTPKDELMMLPTGDGMAIGFLHGLEKPLNLAKEVQEKLNSYNTDKVSIDKIAVRIGCHTGNVFVVNDVFGNKNFWGPGIILARRVMDLGDDGHILMTAQMAESLSELDDEYKQIIHPLHDYEIKHGQTMLLYSVHGKGFGNPERPKRGLTGTGKIMKEVTAMKKTIQYEKVEFNLSLKNVKTNLMRNKRRYQFKNDSEEPIYEIVSGIITSVEKTFFDLNVKATDEHDEPLKIAGINVDTPFRKEFTIKLNTPVFQGENGRIFSLEYEVNEAARFYEKSIFD